MIHAPSVFNPARAAVVIWRPLLKRVSQISLPPRGGILQSSKSFSKRKPVSAFQLMSTNLASKSFASCSRYLDFLRRVTTWSGVTKPTWNSFSGVPFSFQYV